MDLHSLYRRERAGIGGYRIPESYELAGKSLDIDFTGGEKQRLEFSALPERILTLAGKPVSYKNVKIGARRFCVSCADAETFYVFAIDTDSGIVISLSCAAGKTNVRGGAIVPGQPCEQYNASDDFAGNAFEWSFGPESSFIAAVEYGESGVTVSFPYADENVPNVSVSDFTAVKFAEGVYLQSAVVTADEKTYIAALVTDLNNMLCAGSVYSAESGAVESIGGYGRAVKN